MDFGNQICYTSDYKAHTNITYLASNCSQPFRGNNLRIYGTYSQEDITVCEIYAFGISFSPGTYSKFSLCYLIIESFMIIKFL